MTKTYKRGDRHAEAEAIADGGSLIVLSSGNSKIEHDALKRDAASRLRDALRRLQNTVNALNDPLSASVKKQALAAFLCDPMTEAELDKVREVVRLIQKGLKGNVLIKTGPAIDRNEPGADGAVVSRQYGKRGAEHKPYHNPIVRMLDGKEYHYHDIKIKDETLHHDVFGVQTLIHEASHKYAGTHDYAYFDDMGAKPKKALTRPEALKNADSFGWFIYHTGAA